jgi:hypothetical protein
LSKRFGEGLGCDAAAILASHRQAVNALSTSTNSQASTS